MKLVFHRNFEKNYRKLQEKDKIKVQSILKQFMQNPFLASLKNHELQGKLLGKRAISVKSDLRIIFEEFDCYLIVLLLDVGTHNQVY